MEVGQLRPEQVITWQSELLAALSPKTVAETRATLRAILEEARNLGLVSENVVDPCEAADDPTTSASSAHGCRGPTLVKPRSAERASMRMATG
jgi:hypothetical protein